MHIHPIRNDGDHEAVLREIEALWGAEEASGTGDRLDILATLVEDYERGRWQIELLDPAHTTDAPHSTPRPERRR